MRSFRGPECPSCDAQALHAKYVASTKQYGFDHTERIMRRNIYKRSLLQCCSELHLGGGLCGNDKEAGC